MHVGRLPDPKLFYLFVLVKVPRPNIPKEAVSGRHTLFSNAAAVAQSIVVVSLRILATSKLVLSQKKKSHFYP